MAVLIIGLAVVATTEAGGMMLLFVGLCRIPVEKG